ncbi:MAG: hypothetical protein AAFR59_12720, partial [Bacteroidota bacterium]
SANRFNEDADIYDYIKLIFEDNVQRSVTLRPSSSREKLAKRIQAYVREYDELLYVKINAGQLGFIEFQFYRYEIQEVDTTFRIDSLFDTRSNELIATDTIIDLPVHTYKRSSSIFINLQDDPSVQIIALRNAITQVFDETNQAPEVLISGNGRRYEEVLYFAVGDTIRLEVEVFDPDSRKEFFSYEWRQLTPDTLVSGLTLINNQAIQQMIISDTGYYEVSVRVNDGIVSSDEKNISLHIIERPQLRLDRFADPYFRRKLPRTNITYQSFWLSKEKRFLDRFNQWQVGKILGDSIQEISFILVDKNEKYRSSLVLEEDESRDELILQPLGDSLLKLYRYYEKYGYRKLHDEPFVYKRGRLDIYRKELTSALALTELNTNGYFYCLYMPVPLDANTFQENETSPPSLVVSNIYFYAHFPASLVPPPGEYEFELKAVSKGVESEPVPLPVEVKKLSAISLNTGMRWYLTKNAFDIYSVYGGMNMKLMPWLDTEVGITLNDLFTTNASFSRVIPYVRTSLLIQTVRDYIYERCSH